MYRLRDTFFVVFFYLFSIYILFIFYLFSIYFLSYFSLIFLYFFLFKKKYINVVIFNTNI